MSMAVSHVALPFSEATVCRCPAPVIVLCYGFAGRQGILLPEEAQAFARAGFVVVTFDYWGFGDSIGERRRLTAVTPCAWRTEIRRYGCVVSQMPVLDGKALVTRGMASGERASFLKGLEEREVRRRIDDNELWVQVSMLIQDRAVDDALVPETLYRISGAGYYDLYRAPWHDEALLVQRAWFQAHL